MLEAAEEHAEGAVHVQHQVGRLVRVRVRVRARVRSGLGVGLVQHQVGPAHEHSALEIGRSPLTTWLGLG